MSSQFIQRLLNAMLVLALLALGACSPKTNHETLSSGLTATFGDEEIVSTRQQDLGTVVVLVKLKNPPLLSQLENRQIDKELKAEIDKEQAEALQEMAKISPDIKLVFRYQLVINALAMSAPSKFIEQLQKLSAVSHAELSQKFDRPQVKVTEIPASSSAAEDFSLRNSVKFIGGEAMHALGFSGQGVKVGIIDTGIDYTHSMLGGPGTVDAFKSVDPKKATSLFPNKKVVGGIDLVGTDFDSAAALPAKRIPHPDENPMDEGGHGSHVAGTVAGLGDGVKTYSGVAPEAQLYAIKVFGAEGSTSDEVVIAALEYAANPARDGSLNGQLDVVNLSLGSGYGNPHILYAEAIRNLSNAGTAVVISAGNSGNENFIVGAPGTSDEAISVAASIDDLEHNWKFAAVKFTNPEAKEYVAEAIEGSISKPIADAGAVSGELVFIGNAAQDLDAETAAKVKGKVALIDRGVVTFAEKVKRAAGAGATGVVVANNVAGEAFAMGGDGKFDIPAIMITQGLGDQLKKDMKAGAVRIDYQTPLRIEKPELIDTITGFSSKGPRSVDGFFKPEIAAPGSDIISAEKGGGKAAVKMSGTSMAAPHMAGVAALIKQAHPELSSAEMKSVLMGTAKTIFEKKDARYPLSRMGAGRVQVDKAHAAIVATEPASISLGLVNVQSKKTLPAVLRVKNLKDQTRVLSLSLEDAAKGLSLKPVADVKLAGKATAQVALKLTLDTTVAGAATEMDGFIVLKDGKVEVLRVPVLAVVQHISQLTVGDVKVHASVGDAEGASADLEVKNAAGAKGSLLLFNLLGTDGRKQAGVKNPFVSNACDLESVGYRIITRQKEKILQVALKMYQPVTSWSQCELSVLIDTNKDGEAEQEIAGMSLGTIPGSGTAKPGFGSYLLNATKARDLRRQFEAAVASGDTKVKEDYSSALLAAQPMTTYDVSTVAVLEAPISELAVRENGVLGIKVLTSHYESAPSEVDDMLGGLKAHWLTVSTNENDQAFKDLPESTEVAAGASSVIVDLTKGAGSESLLVLAPQNSRSLSNTIKDSQSKILKPVYEP